jgi:zinc finger protein ubi-d4
MERTDRMPGVNHGQLFSYPAKRWKKKRRQYLMNDSYLSKRIREAQQHQQFLREQQQNSSNNNHTNISSEANGSVDESSNSGINDNNKLIDAREGSSSNNNTNNHHHHSNSDSNDSKLFGQDSHSRGEWYGDYEESDLMDAGELDDPESDYDEFEEYGRKKKKRGKDSAVGKRKRIEYTDAEKPYACELCGARYKTRPGLSYHYAHSHQNENNGNSSGPTALDEESNSYNNSYGSGRGPGTPVSTMGNPGGPPTTPNMAGPPVIPPHPYGHHINPQMPGYQGMHPSQHPGRGSPSTPTGSIHGSRPPQENPSSERGLFDPQFNDGFGGNRPPGKGSVHAPQDYCDFCLGDSGENKKTNSAEILVSCSDCGRSAHPSCLQFTANMIESVKKYRWQCIECKSCGLCGTSDNDVSIVFSAFKFFSVIKIFF